MKENKEDSFHVKEKALLDAFFQNDFNELKKL